MTRQAPARRTLYRLRLDWTDGHQTWSAWYNTLHEARVVSRSLANVASIYNIELETL